MKKYVIIGIAVVVVLLGVYVSFYFYTKSFSPRASAEYQEGDLQIKVFYGRPYKKGRVIFGDLEPYGKVWRTGANEATTFETNQDLLINETLLKAGKYTLWTIPNERVWTVIFNNKTTDFGGMPLWGIGYNRAAKRESDQDALTVEVPSLVHEKVIEQFTIFIHKMDDELELVLLWDKTLVAVPISVVSAQ